MPFAYASMQMHNYPKPNNNCQYYLYLSINLLVMMLKSSFWDSVVLPLTTKILTALAIGSNAVRKI